MKQSNYQYVVLASSVVFWVGRHVTQMSGISTEEAGAGNSIMVLDAARSAVAVSKPLFKSIPTVLLRFLQRQRTWAGLRLQALQVWTVSLLVKHSITRKHIRVTLSVIHDQTLCPWMKVTEKNYDIYMSDINNFARERMYKKIYLWVKVSNYFSDI